MAALDDLEFRRVNCFDDAMDFKAWLGERRDWLAVDVETTGLNAGCDYVRLSQFGDSRMGWALDHNEWRGLVREAIETYRDSPIVGHNILYDSKMLKREGISIPQHLMHDTMVMTFLLDPGARIDLKGAAALHVDRRAQMGKNALQHFMSGGGFTWATVPTDAPPYWIYGVLDTCLTALLAEKIFPQTGGGQFREAYELNMAVINCLRDSELAGMLVDEEYRRRAASKLEADLAELRAQLPINPGSDTQVRAHLQSIGAPLYVVTDAGNLSVDKNVLKGLVKMDPVRFRDAGLIQDFRSKSRMLGSYIEKFADVSEGGLAVDGVLHCSAHPVGGLDESGKQRGTRTGRLSVTDPPLQTLPRGRIIRDAIVARPGHRILQADFKGMELRALASLAGEESMLEVFNNGGDLHNFVAESVYGPGFTPQQRGTAKNAGFAKIYGAGVDQFAATAGISVDDAQSFLDRYDVMFPRVAEFMHMTVQEVMAQAGDRRGRGWVTLPDGTRLPVPGDKAYVGVNYKIQGGTAVAAKRKLCELDAAGLGEFFRLAVHDEFLFEVPEEHVDAAREVIRTVMPDRRTYPGVVLEIDQDEVHRWGEHYRGDAYPAYVETEPAPWLREEAA